MDCYSHVDWTPLQVYMIKLSNEYTLYPSICISRNVLTGNNQRVSKNESTRICSLHCSFVTCHLKPKNILCIYVPGDIQGPTALLEMAVYYSKA